MSVFTFAMAFLRLHHLHPSCIHPNDQRNFFNRWKIEKKAFIKIHKQRHHDDMLLCYIQLVQQPFFNLNFFFSFIITSFYSRKLVDQLDLWKLCADVKIQLP